MVGCRGEIRDDDGVLREDGEGGGVGRKEVVIWMEGLLNGLVMERQG